MSIPSDGARPERAPNIDDPATWHPEWCDPNSCDTTTGYHKSAPVEVPGKYPADVKISLQLWTPMFEEAGTAPVSLSMTFDLGLITKDIREYDLSDDQAHRLFVALGPLAAVIDEAGTR